MRLGVFWVGTGTMFGCGGSPTVVWHEEEGHRWAALSVPRRGTIGFRQLPASETGIEFSNVLTGFLG